MKNLAAALIKAQLDMDPLHTDAKNPHLNSKYATLAGVQEVALPSLGKYEIAVMQSVSTDWNETGALVKVGCTLMHAPSGEFVTNEIALRPTKSDPQGIGSAITYGRRYLLMTMAGLAPEDDDGNEASGKQTTQKQQAQPQRQAQPQAQSQQPTHRQQDNTAPAISVPKSFADADAAIKWGYDTKAFEAIQHAKNAYDKLKTEHKPKDAATMFDLWINDVKRRLEEKQQEKA